MCHGTNHIPTLGLLPRFADLLMDPIMRIASGSVHESPQRTHRWNNRKLSEEEVDNLDLSIMAYFMGIENERSFGNSWRFHVPLLGGWRKYIVVRPEFEDDEVWYVGWLNKHVRGMSLIPIRGSVRLLLGPHPTYFFGLSESDGCELEWFSPDPLPPKHPQIKIRAVGGGIIGVRCEHSKLPLL